MVLTKKINIDQWNKIQGPQVKPGTTDILSLTKKARIYNGENTSSSITGAGKTGQLMCRRMKLEHFLTPYTIINSKSIKGLNVWIEAINF